MADCPARILTHPGQMEILAPVGGQEQLLAAVRCGANAVYFGAKGFNARRNAENFDDLPAAVAYCHARDVRVHITVNTLVMDDELPALLNTLREVAASGADAVIVQDLAVARLVRERCPELSMHASTQMTIHNAAGARQARELGFSRVVLARELSLAEIRKIADATDIELEAFVHGALCVSASGACYLSSMLGGRSGNRGLCAQPCRLDFRAEDGRAFALSLKDLSALGHVDALRQAGICSLKIEGRMKRPEYVAAAVTACREAIGGRPYDVETLEAVFSRGGFTDGYLTGKRDLSMYGVRDHEDVQASQRVQGRLQALYRKERQAVPVDMRLTLRTGEASVLSVWDDRGNSVRECGAVPQPAQSAETDELRARSSLSKCGDTPFFLRALAVENDGALMLSASALNALRRGALVALLALREKAVAKAFDQAPLPDLPQHTPKPRPALYIRAERAAQVPDSADADRIILPIEEITPECLSQYGDRLAAELPALLFPGHEGAVAARLSALKASGLCWAAAENLGAVRIARDAGLHVLGGHGLNVLGSLSLEEYAALGVHELTVSFELHREKLRRLAGGLPRGALAYGYLPLMRLRACPAKGRGGCGACSGSAVLTDRTGARFSLLCHKKEFSSLLNAVPLNLSGETLAGADFLTLYFTTETPRECQRIYEAFRAGDAPEGPRTRGLYHRALL